MHMDEHYHPGEIAVQERARERGPAIRNGGAIATRIIPGALRFIAQQPMVVLGSVATGGRVWASVVFGEPGFAAADDRRVTFDLERAIRDSADPLWANLGPAAPIGVLFI